MEQKAPRKFNTVYCPHCKKEVSKSTWYVHYNNFYDKSAKSWKSTPEITTSSIAADLSSREADFDFDGMEFEEFGGVKGSADTNCEMILDDHCHGFDSSLDHYETDSDSDSGHNNLESTEEFPEQVNGEDELEIWESEDDMEKELDEEEQTSFSKFITLICVFLLSWQNIFRIPDFAINTLFKFFHVMLSRLADILKSESLKSIYKIFPENLDQARKMNYINRESFKKYITCQKCHCTYSSELCLTNAGVTENIVKCSFVRFPRHQQKCMRIPCQFPLLKIIKTATGKKVLQPLKVFCYKNIIESIRELVQKPGMLDLLNHWRCRTMPNGVMADVYDGVVWNSFLTVDGKDFLNSRYSIGLMINVDWFQPYKHVQYSVGAIYLIILNLPRNLRYRRENMILVGIIPGPHEPSLSINSFLEPLIIDLNKLWKGIQIETSEGKQQFLAVLICNSSDIPACRKVGGFVGHGATKGCSRCLKSFASESHNFGDKLDYSGFNPASWPCRTVNEHRVQGMAWKHAQSMADRSKIEREFGVRFTELLRLPYFDTVRYSVVDPMHNILLGTPKHMITVWKEKGYLCNAKFNDIQVICDRFTVPTDVGRIPHKISSGFASFTADQWKNWTLIYSLVALKNVLPIADYACWKLYVKACILVCSKAITLDAVSQCHDYLLSFCRSFEQLYGAQLCTPNMHLHCHLKECLFDYGPGCSIWLFACERLNGFLGSVPTNHKSIEVQLMHKFTSTQQILQLYSMCDDPSFKELLNDFQFSKGSLKYETLPDLPITVLSVANIENINKFCRQLYPIKEACLSSTELECIDTSLKNYFGIAYVRTLMLHRVSRAIMYCGNLYGSVNSVHSRSSLVYIRCDSITYAPAFVQRYITVTTILKEGTDTLTIMITLACVNRLQPHQHKDWFGFPVEVWRAFHPSIHPDAYVPVTNLLCRCAYITESITFGLISDTVTIVVPINNFAGL